MIEVECKSVRRVEVRREVKRKREKKIMEEEREEEQRKMRETKMLFGSKIVGKKGRRGKMGKEIKYCDDGCTNLLHRPCGLQ